MALTFVWVHINPNSHRNHSHNNNTIWVSRGNKQTRFRLIRGRRCGQRGITLHFSLHFVLNGQKWPTATQTQQYQVMRTEQYFENKSFQSICIEPKKVFALYLNPKVAQEGPNAVKIAPQTHKIKILSKREQLTSITYIRKPQKLFPGYTETKK